ncbi:hypothetical protein [Armatimonas sp.]|uniref:hypothetical protein n=1 Tax=Armatimonas sp. TaxID=1872638 RepID=UPI00286CBC21|nr:hypothetical protein [Armatimonas sp.]
MARDPIPADDDNLLVELDRFLGALSTPEAQTASGVSAVELAKLKQQRDTLASKNAVKREQEAAWRASVQQSKEARTDVVALFRKQRRAASNALGMTNDLRARAGLPLS